MTQSVIPKHESLEVEFKSDRDCLNDDDLVEALICLANAQGGTLYLGVENDAAHTGLHISRPADMSSLAALVANRTAPRLQVHVQELLVAGVRAAAIAARLDMSAGRLLCKPVGVASFSMPR